MKKIYIMDYLLPLQKMLYKGFQVIFKCFTPEFQ